MQIAVIMNGTTYSGLNLHKAILSLTCLIAQEGACMCAYSYLLYSLYIDLYTINGSLCTQMYYYQPYTHDMLIKGGYPGE